MVSAGLMGGVASAQQDTSDTAPASATCAQVQGGVQTQGSFFRTCISTHGNVVDYTFGCPLGANTFFNGNCPNTVGESFPGNQEGYFVYHNEDAPGFRCFWDTGPSEHPNWVSFTPTVSGGNYKVIRRNDIQTWELEQNFGVNEFSKLQKIVMVYRNLGTTSDTGVRVGRYANLDAESSSTDDVFVESDIDTGVTGFDTDSPDGAGSGVTIFPRSYRATPKTAVETFDSWAGVTSSNPSWDEPCSPQAVVTTPSPVGDFVAWAWYELGTVTAGNTKLVVYEYRAV